MPIPLKMPARSSTAVPLAITAAVAAVILLSTFLFWGGSQRQSARRQNDRDAAIIAKACTQFYLAIMQSPVDNTEQQVIFTYLMGNLRRTFPEIDQVAIVDDKGIVMVAADDRILGRAYQPPMGGITMVRDDSLNIQGISRGKVWINTPIVSNETKTFRGAVKMVIDYSRRPAAGSGGRLAALAVGILAALLGLAGMFVHFKYLEFQTERASAARPAQPKAPPRITTNE